MLTKIKLQELFTSLQLVNVCVNFWIFTIGTDVVQILKFLKIRYQKWFQISESSEMSNIYKYSEESSVPSMQLWSISNRM